MTAPAATPSAVCAGRHDTRRAARSGAVRCGAVRCGAVRCGAAHIILRPKADRAFVRFTARRTDGQRRVVLRWPPRDSWDMTGAPRTCSMKHGNSATAEIAAISQQSPTAPWHTSFGSILLKSRGWPPWLHMRSARAHWTWSGFISCSHPIQSIAHSTRAGAHAHPARPWAALPHGAS